MANTIPISSYLSPADLEHDVVASGANKYAKEKYDKIRDSKVLYYQVFNSGFRSATYTIYYADFGSVAVGYVFSTGKYEDRGAKEVKIIPGGPTAPQDATDPKVLGDLGIQAEAYVRLQVPIAKEPLSFTTQVVNGIIYTFIYRGLDVPVVLYASLDKPPKFTIISQPAIPLTPLNQELGALSGFKAPWELNDHGKNAEHFARAMHHIKTELLAFQTQVVEGMNYYFLFRGETEKIYVWVAPTHATSARVA